MSESGAPSAPPVGSSRGWVLDAVAGVSDGILIIDPSARLVYQNAAAARFVEADTFDTSTATWPELHGVYHSEDGAPMRPEELPLLRALRGEDVRDDAIFIRNRLIPRGVHFLVNASPLRDPEGRIRGAACIFRDVTALREKEAQLREGARQKKAILDNIPEMAWLKDEHGSFLLVNQPLADAMGRESPFDLVGMTDHDFLPKEIADRYRADDERVMATGMRLRIEEPFVDSAGRARWIETNKARIVDDKGKVIGTTGIARDVTERKLAEDHMLRAQAELELRVAERTAALAAAQEHIVRQERLAVLGQLAGGVAHQIRNPLAAIMNATFVLRRHWSPEQHANVDDAITIIHDEVRHANSIITGLLDYARVRTPDRHPVSITNLLSRLLEADWIPANIHVIEDLPAGDAVVRNVDGDQLQSAIASLLHNAIEAMPDGGDLRVSLLTEGDGAVIRIHDSGPGIHPQLRPHLFEPLRSTKPLGIGLGLVTARRLVEAHGGRIVSVDRDRGACFEIHLPR